MCNLVDTISFRNKPDDARIQPKINPIADRKTLLNRVMIGDF